MVVVVILSSSIILSPVVSVVASVANSVVVINSLATVVVSSSGITGHLFELHILPSLIFLLQVVNCAPACMVRTLICMPPPQLRLHSLQGPNSEYSHSFSSTLSGTAFSSRSRLSLPLSVVGRVLSRSAIVSVVVSETTGSLISGLSTPLIDVLEIISVDGCFSYSVVVSPESLDSSP